MRDGVEQELKILCNFKNIFFFGVVYNEINS